MKQTAVEWLFENLIDLNTDMNHIIITWEEYLSKRAGLLDQAKAMEKQEKIDFANNYGFDICAYDYERAEQYYNETIK